MWLHLTNVNVVRRLLKKFENIFSPKSIDRLMYLYTDVLSSFVLNSGGQLWRMLTYFFFAFSCLFRFDVNSFDWKKPWKTVFVLDQSSWDFSTFQPLIRHLSNENERTKDASIDTPFSLLPKTQIRVRSPHLSLWHTEPHRGKKGCQHCWFPFC